MSQETKLTKKERVKRLMQVILLLEACDGEGNSGTTWNGIFVDNFYVCNMYKDMFEGSKFEIDYPEFILLTLSKRQTWGAFFTDGDDSTQDCRNQKIIILLLLIEIIK